jgi:arylsulfatase A-like enzyme
VILLAWLACAPSPDPTPPGPWLQTRLGPPPTTAAPAGARPVVLIVGCTVRADQATPYGGPPGVTPFLAGLAAEGATFDDAIAAAPWTRPAATALLTGRHALSVGMADPASTPDARVLPASVGSLAEHLREHGWTTIGVSTNPNVHSRWGLDQGFVRWSEPVGTWTADGVKLPGTVAVAEVSSALADAAGEDHPVFLLVVLVDAHSPFEADDADRAALADPTVPAEVVEYRAALRRFDARAGEVVAAARRALRDPVIAVVSDHGEGLSFPTHHGRAHGRFLAPSAVRELWIVAGPGVPAGVRVPGVASQLDVAPTLVALAGAPAFPAEGVDRTSTVRGGPPVAPQLALVDTWFQEVDRAAVYGPEVACQADFSGRPPSDGFVDGCFDRRADPTHTLAFADPLADEIVRFRAARESAAPAPAAEDDPGVDAQLRALGYR